MTNREELNKNEIIDKVTPAIEKAAGDLNLTVLEINFVKEAGDWHLRIFIYSPDHPIAHIDCESLTRNLGEYLDPLIPGHYYLEVSSPGLDRKFKSPKEYNIFRGKKVEVKLKQPQDDLKLFKATIIDYNPEEGLKVQPENTDKAIIIPDKNISSVRLKSDFKI